MLNNVRYDKIKLLHKLCRLVWFIEKHGIKDAEQAGDQKALELMQNLQKDLQSYLHKLDDMCAQKHESCDSC